MAHIIAIVGAFGAGKSTCAMALARSLSLEGHTPESVALVVNEVGGLTEVRSPYARVVTLPNGCFTCEDESRLKEELSRLSKEGVAVVIMEGFGIVAGTETESFLKSTGHTFQILAVLDAENHVTNMVLYGSLLRTHVGVATAGILVTKCAKDEVPDSVLEFMLGHMQSPSYALRVPPEALPQEVLHAALSRSRMHTVSHCHTGACGHDHSHDNEGVHGWSTFAFLLKPAVDVADLEHALGEIVKQGHARVKGEIHGVAFNAAPGSVNWHYSLCDVQRGSFLVLYTPAGVLPPLAALAELVAEVCVTDMRRSYEILRDSVADTSMLVARIQEGIASINACAPIVTAQGHLVTHPEVPLQLTKEMSRRPEVQSEWFFPTIQACLRYWVKCVAMLSRSVFRDEGTTSRELGVSLAWWAHEFQDRLDPELHASIIAAKPALLVAHGLQEVNALRSDPFWRYWQVREYLRAFQFGILTAPEWDEITQARVHVLSLVPSEERAHFE